MVSLDKSIKCFKRSESNFTCLSENRRLTNLFLEASITLISKPDNDSANNENYRLKFLMNIHAKILNKICK